MLIRPATPDDTPALATLAGMTGQDSAAFAAQDRLMLVAEDDDGRPSGFLVARYDVLQKNAAIESLHADDAITKDALAKNAEAALNNMGCFFAGTAPPADDIVDSVIVTTDAPDTPATEESWADQSISDNFAENA